MLPFLLKYRKSSIKPPLSNKPPLFSGGKLIRPPSLLSLPSRSPIRLSQLIHEGEQRYKPYTVGHPRMVTPPLKKPGYAPGLEVNIVFSLRPHDLQLHMLNFSTLRSSSLWRIVTI